MPATQGRKPRLILVPSRALLVTFLITLLSFAVSLLLGIVGVLIYSRVYRIRPNLTMAYRNIAAPCAVVVAYHATDELHDFALATALEAP